MTPIAYAFLGFMVVVFGILVGLALKFKGKGHSAPHAPGEKPHPAFTILCYPWRFLVVLPVVELAVYWYVNGIHPEWTKLAMIGTYVVLLTVWDSLAGWYRTTVRNDHHHPSAPRITLERTAYSVVFPIVSLVAVALFFVLVLQPLAKDKDWDGTWFRLYEAPVFVIWLMLVAHIERLINLGSGPVIVAWCLGILTLPYLYGGWTVQPFTGFELGGNIAPGWLLWLFPPG